jgi:NADH-quinone oxidoreductase subunit C
MPLAHNFLISVAKNIDAACTAVEHHGDLTIKVSQDSLLNLLNELKENPETQFNQLLDVTAIDWNTSPDRFEVVYTLYSIPFATHLRVKIGVREDRLHVPSVVEIWESANWYERETYDMYGIIFDGHPDLRRFFMPEDFMDADGVQLYPLRKDFPLMGIPGSLPLPPKD